MPRKYVRKTPAVVATAEAMVWVTPRKGYILAGIPATGASVPKALADEWRRMGLLEGK